MVWHGSKYLSSGVSVSTRVVRNISEFLQNAIVIVSLEHVSLMRKEDILSFTATWMDNEHIMLSEINRTEKDRYCMISLTCGILESQTLCFN